MMSLMYYLIYTTICYLNNQCVHISGKCDKKSVCFLLNKLVKSKDIIFILNYVSFHLTEDLHKGN